ncbi:Uncharacterised protein [Vibrio cholerae]|nr:Uncharacterised protein [Vibrio cholerae]
MFTTGCCRYQTGLRSAWLLGACAVSNAYGRDHRKLWQNHGQRDGGQHFKPERPSALHARKLQ